MNKMRFLDYIQSYIQSIYVIVILQILYFIGIKHKINPIKFVTVQEIKEMNGEGVQESQVLSQINEFIDQKLDMSLLNENRPLNQSQNVVYKEILAYLSQFLAKEHPQLGRKGPVCPFIPGCLKMNSVYLSIVEDENLTQVHIKRIVASYLDQFEQIHPTEEKTKLYKAIVIIFPKVKLSEATTLIDGVQRDLKAQFIKRGMMIGEFHMLNNSSGLRNPCFFPLRTPYPCIAMRYMVATDLAFMTPQECSDQTKSEFLKGYINNFGSKENWARQVEMAQLQLEQLMQLKQD